MAEFHYEGIDRSGKKVSSQIDAPNEGELRMVLRSQGIRPTKITKHSSIQMTFTELLGGGLRNIPVEVVSGFTRQLQILISSGIPLVQGLEILAEQSSHSTFKSVIQSVQEKVSQGSYLWEALSRYPQVFPKLFVALIRAGEASGSLEAMLKRLSRYMEDSNRIRRMIKSAMMYPVVVSFIGLSVVVLMIVFVIPKFEEMLRTSGQELPAPTKFLIETSHFIMNNAVVLVGVVGISGYILIRYLRSNEGRGIVDRIVYRMPLFGGLAQKGGIARFARTMQTLLMSGINLIDAIDICRATIDNVVLEEAVSKIRADVEAGKPFGLTLSKLNVFPKIAVQMISVGESTGNLDKMLEKVAVFFEEEVETVVGGLSKLIEPFVLAFLGIMVGGILIAMYLPVFKIASSVQ